MTASTPSTAATTSRLSAVARYRVTPKVSPAAAVTMRATATNGMIVQWAGYPGTNICRVFHSEKYFREELAGGVTVVDFVPGGAEDADRQDVFLLRKIPTYP